MTIDDKIEKRALNKVQINHILDVLVNDKKKVKGFYNFRDTYVFKEINGAKYLFDKKSQHTNVQIKYKQHNSYMLFLVVLVLTKKIKRVN